jgi:hypothetical protein
VLLTRHRFETCFGPPSAIVAYGGRQIPYPSPTVRS